MIPVHYIWFTWATALLIPWVVLYIGFSTQRCAMLWASLFTTPFGLTEPLFVPAYWNPPSLFDFAQRTGFDIESFIFCFAIGGVGAVTYDVLTGRHPTAMPVSERHASRHRHHHIALAAPFLTFAILVWLPWNPIYPGIVAMFVGAASTLACRMDLAKRTWAGGPIFLVYYLVFLVGVELTSPDYIQRVWNFSALTGVRLWRFPIEELLFAFGFGMYWSSVYEHFTWRRLTPCSHHSQISHRSTSESSDTQ